MSQNRLIVIIFYLVFHDQSFGQVAFKSKELEQIFNSGTAMSTADVNGDLLPDLVIINQGAELWVGYNTASDKFFWVLIDEEIDGNPWSINVVDINHDQKNDIILSGESFGVLLYEQSINGTFAKSVIDSTPYYSQAASATDLNKDGFPELFVCGEFEESRYYNNLNGELIRDTTVIDLTLTEKDSDYGNYGIVWTDIDNDMDMDIYISRCRPDVSDPNDRRRRNLFFHNKAGNFIEEADIRNISVLDQTWISEVGDLDNDGLQDLIVLNHYTPSLIFKQKPDHTFEDVTQSSGFEYKANGMQVILRDFDNDMDLDIFIVGEKNELWINQGNMRFSNANLKFISTPINSCAVADLDNDGAMDLLTAYGDFINSHNNIRNRLFMGQPSSLHYIGFNLIGDRSNTNAVGAKIRLFVKGQFQLRELRSGEAFGIQNSYQLHFGLGTNLEADSIVIEWPNGNLSRYKQLKADQYYTLSEKDCFIQKALLNKGSEQKFCNPDSLELKTIKRYSQINWSNGIAADFIYVKESGVYFCSAKDELDCDVISAPVFVEKDPDEHPLLNYSGSVHLCFEDEIILNSSGYKNILWSNNIISDELRVSQSGFYFGKAKGVCKEYNTDTLVLKKFSEINPPLIRDTIITAPSSINLSSDSEQTYWYYSASQSQAIYSGKIYVTPVINSSTEFWLERFSFMKEDPKKEGLSRPEFNSIPFHTQTLNGGLYFSVHENCTLDSVTVYTDRTGLRRFILKDSIGMSIDSVESELLIGKNRVRLNFKLTDNTYFLTTSESLNRKNFLNVTPWLQRSDKGFQYPIQNSELVTILHSAVGEAEYHYFYDWKLSRNDKICVSKRVPLKVSLMNVGTKNISDALQVSFYNNNNQLHIDNHHVLESVSLHNVLGTCIFQTKIVNSIIDLPNKIPGYYIIQFRLKDGQLLHYCRFIE